MSTPKVEYFSKENLPTTVACIVLILLIVRMLMRSSSTTTTKEHNSVGLNRGFTEGINDYGGFTTSADAANMASLKKFGNNKWSDDAIAAALLQCGNDVHQAGALLLKADNNKDKNE